MPSSSSSSSQFILNGLSLSHFQKFIPKKWKQPQQTVIDDVSMIDNLVISLEHFATEGNLLKALETFSLIQQRHASLLRPLSSLLLCCTNAKSLSQGRQVHARVISSGLDRNPVLVPRLVAFYTSFNLLKDAHVIVCSSNTLFTPPWNSLISSYVRNGLYGDALSTYKQMKVRGVLPDNFTYPSVLKACGKMLDVNLAREVHKSIVASQLDCSLVVRNALISMFGNLGEVDDARNLFDKMKERDVFSWNTMISCYASKGMWVEANELFEEMQDLRVDINIITWNTVAGVCSKAGEVEKALHLISQLRTGGVRLDSVAILIGLGACSRMGTIKLGKEIHGVAIRSCCDVFDNVKNALITMYSRCTDLRHAFMLFQLMEAKSIITWNSMISGFAAMDQSEEATFLFRELLLSKIEPTYVTIAIILPLCARVANLKHGKEFHCYITRREGFKDRLILWNALVETYARSGKVVEARRLFDMMSERDEVTYTSLIAGYGMQGEGRMALKLFDEMNRLGIKPDHVTMIAVLSSCSHSGLVNEGQKIFGKMQCDYGIVPRLEHFACMVDLYGRAGLLNKARDIFTKMAYSSSYRPTSAMWATLIGACRIHRNTEIGEWAAEKLLEMRPGNSGYYALIANMYAANGCWDKLAKVRILMRDLGVNKDPGGAWVDVGDGFTSFVAGDTSNLQALKVYPMLERLTDLMKDAGYIGSTDSGSEYEVLEEMASSC